MAQGMRIVSLTLEKEETDLMNRLVASGRSYLALELAEFFND